MIGTILIGLNRWIAGTTAGRAARSDHFRERRFLLPAIAIVTVLFVPGAGFLYEGHAQAQAAVDGATKSIADTWQGTLHSGKDRRLALKISKTGTNGYQADLYDLDRGGDPTRVSKVTEEGAAIKLNLAVLGAKYAGTLSADGKSITGLWSQYSSSLPLELTRATPATAWELPAAQPLPAMMAADVSPSFEVATIKPSQPDETKKYIRVGLRFQAADASLNDLIIFAYGEHPKQVVGAPAWAETDKFDIEGKADRDGLPNLDQWKIMMRKLLAERCRLSFHQEQKELPVYLLSVGKGGPRITASGGDPNGRPGLGVQRTGTGADLSAYNATVNDFINFMTRYVKLDRPVLDRTGMSGRYDFTLNWMPDESQFGGTGKLAPPTVDAGVTLPSLYTAVQEQLGLKLEAIKAPAEVMVIDHIEKPSEN